MRYNHRMSSAFYKSVWNELPKTAPFEHPKDATALYNTYNHLAPAKRPHTELLPNPVAGNLDDAEVVLLTKFPLYNPQEKEDYENVDGYMDACRKSMTFENDDYPFFFLNPAFSETFAFQWWQPKLAKLVEDCGLENVARKVMTISYFPYHMESFMSNKEILYTQKSFCFGLAQEARAKGKKIVLLSYKKEWSTLMPFQAPITLTTDRNMTITPTSIAGERYPELVKAIKGEE